LAMRELPTWAGAEMIRMEDEGHSSKDAEIARLRAENERLRLIRCPDGAMHRWDYDGQCKECANYATDLIDRALLSVRD